VEYEKEKKPMIYYVYSLSPTDWWHGFLTPAEYLKQCDCGDEYTGLVEDARQWLAEMRQVVQAADFWEGDYGREHVSAVPNDECDGTSVRLYIVKQSNNGTTFLVSPVPLYHLRESTCKIVEFVSEPTP